MTAARGTRAARRRPPRPVGARRVRHDDRYDRRRPWSQRAACSPDGWTTTCRIGRHAPTDHGPVPHAPGRAPTAAAPGHLAGPGGDAGPGLGGAAARHRRPVAVRTAFGFRWTAAARRSTAGQRALRVPVPGRTRPAATRRGRQRSRDATAAQPARVRAPCRGRARRGRCHARWYRPHRTCGHRRHDGRSGRATAPGMGGAARPGRRYGGRRWRSAHPHPAGRGEPATPTPPSSAPGPAPHGRRRRAPPRQHARHRWHPRPDESRGRPDGPRRFGRHGAGRHRRTPRPARADRSGRRRTNPAHPAGGHFAGGRSAESAHPRPDHRRSRRQAAAAGPVNRPGHTHRSRPPSGRPNGGLPRLAESLGRGRRRSAAGPARTWLGPRRWRHRRTSRRG